MVAHEGNGRNSQLQQIVMRTSFRFILILGVLAACARSTSMSASPQEKTVLRVENQGFADMNIFVLPEGSTRIRLGTATGKSVEHFTLPQNVVPRGVRPLRFIAAPIATPRGDVSDEILVTPGDTVVLIIPPS
jgi:hypothetical protein